MLSSRNYDFGEVETALCVWEWMLDNRTIGTGIGMERVLRERLDTLFGNNGAAAMRSTAVQVAVTADQCWCYEEDGDLSTIFDSFDWEFIPAFCRLIDWEAYVKDNQHGPSQMREDPEAMVAKLFAAHALGVSP